MRLDSTVVALSRCPSYAQPGLDESISQVLGAIEVPDLCSANILLKPNLISVKHGLLACTEAAFILAAARWLLAQGARVSIGDSPAFGTAAMVLQNLGIADELAALGVEIKNFSQGRRMKLPGGGWAVLAEEALDCDMLVNLPRVKVHGQTQLTLAVKNYFGCLLGMRKAWWHMIYGGPNGTFCDRLAQISFVLPPSVTLVDGVTAMHKTGPVRGEPYPLALVGASVNPVAMDTALHKILGVSPEQSPVMAACRRAGLSGAKLEQLRFPLAALDEFQANDFIVPDTLQPVRFSFFRYLKNTAHRLHLQK